LKSLNLTIAILLLVFSCDDGETKLKNENRQQTEFLFALLKYREEGNCRKTVSNTNNSNKIVSCNRKPRGFCNLNQSLITSGDVNFLFSEAKKVRDRTPECETSFIQSGILLTKASTTSEEESIRKNHEYLTLTSCEDDGFVLTNNTKLATLGELLLLESARGRIGYAARVLNSNPLSSINIRETARLCLEKEFNDSERTLFSDVLTGKVLSEIRK